MNEEKLEQELRDYFRSEMKTIEPPSDWWDRAISHLPEREIPSRKIFSGWRRPALIAIPIVVILVALTLIQPWNSTLGPQVVLAKTQDATASLQSYRISLEGTTIDPGQEANVIKVEMEFVAPDLYDVKQFGDTDMEQIFIGNTQYSNNSSPSIGSTVMTNSLSSMLNRDYTLSLLDSLKDIKEFPKETIDGVLCLHYQGTVDYEQQLIDSWRLQEEEGFPVSDEAKKQMLEQAQSQPNTTIDFWIGKDDYLVRQMNWNISADGGGVSMDFRFYDFNQPITIKAPLDPQGNLLPGWTYPTPTP